MERLVAQELEEVELAQGLLIQAEDWVHLGKGMQAAKDMEMQILTGEEEEEEVLAEREA
jgi:hypothetical protein